MDGSTLSPIVYFGINGDGPHEHVCGGGGPVDRIEEWLFREKLSGLTPAEVKLIERLIEDIR